MRRHIPKKAIHPSSVQAAGNANYVVTPVINKSSVFQMGRITIEITEDIVCIDSLENIQTLDLQFNFFTQSGKWLQLIVEPSLGGNSIIGFRDNDFQQWVVDVNAQRYYPVFFPIDSWAQSIFEKGTVASLYWEGRCDDGVNIKLNGFHLEVTKPDQTFDGFVISADEFSEIVLAYDDLILNDQAYFTQSTFPNGVPVQIPNPLCCATVFSLGGIGNGSIVTATSGAGKITYEGLQQDPSGILGEQTAESCNWKYSPMTKDQWGRLVQTFSL